MVEKTGRTYRESTIEALWTYKGICLVVTFLLTRQNASAFHGWFFIYFVATLLARIFFRARPLELCSILPLDFLAILLIAYFPPHSLAGEYLLLPTLLFELPLYYHPVASFAVSLFMGIPGSILLSYSFYQSIRISIGSESHALSFISVFYYVPITLASLLVSLQVAHIGKSDRDAGTMRMLNNQLEKINKNITGKLFHLKQDLAAEERKKISKEIHDAAGYIFVNLISMLQTASVLFHRNPDKAESLINDAREYSSRGINEIRHILYQVRDYSPSLQSLQNELYSIGKSFANATGVAVSVEFGNWPVSFSPRLDMFFISFMQEALTNALKHGLATVIDVRCSIISNVIELAVSDNGRGATEPIRRGIGITSMEEFVGALGGFIRIGSDAVGFTIAASVPASAVDGDAERE